MEKEKDIKEKALQIIERDKKKTKRQNEWIANNYERQTITMPNGTKDRIKAAGETSVNGYMNRLIQEDLKKRGF